MIRACYELGKAKKNKRSASVTIACGKGIEEVVVVNTGETKSDNLAEAMKCAGVDEVDLLRGLYLMAISSVLLGGVRLYIYGRTSDWCRWYKNKDTKLNNFVI